MANKKEMIDSTEEKLLSKITAFITTNKNLILIGLAAVVVVLLAVIIITSAVSSSSEKAFIRVSGYEDSLKEMITSEDSEAVNEFLTSVEKDIKGSKYPSVKSAYILGEYYAATGDWQKAYDYFMKSYNLNSKIYLSSMALFNAAVSSEQLGDNEKALALYSQVSEGEEESPLVSKALFNVARINYQNGNTELAKVTFQQLIDKFPASEYSAIATGFINTL